MLHQLLEKLQNISPNLRKILTNIGWLFADRILRMGVGLIVTAWIARYLGPQGFGLLNYAIAFSFLFTVVAKLGLEQIVVRNIVRDPANKDEVIGTAFFLKISVGIVAFLCSIATILFLKPNEPLTQTIVAIVGSGIIFEAFNSVDFWFQSQVQSKYTVWAQNSAFIIITIIRIILIQTQAPLIAFAWATLVEWALGALGLLIAYNISGQNFLKWRPKLVQAKSLLKESWPLLLSAMAIMVYLRIDLVMLGQLADDTAVGIYSGATRISEIWNFLAIAIVKSLNPAIIAAKKISEDNYYGKLQKLFNLVTVMAYSIAIPMTFLSTPIVVLLFGPDYAAAGGVLSIHIWAGLFTFYGWSKGIWIVTEGLTMYALIASICGAIMNVLLNFLLIPLYRENGAAIATVISYGFTDYITCFIYPPAHRLAGVMTKALTLTFVFNRLKRSQS